MQTNHVTTRRVLFLLTTMPVGGAETLLVNMVRRFDRRRIDPIIGCLKQRDVLGEEIASEVPVFDHLIGHKYDVSVVWKLAKLMKDQQVDAVVTIGAGDKMFWGRIAGKMAGVSVILSALHSTGWPDGVGRLNRLLTPITDGFIAVAQQHAEYQINTEKFPRQKVFLIPNGIDTDHFQFDLRARHLWRQKLSIPQSSPVVGIVAALRPEKNHRLFLQVASDVQKKLPEAQFVVAGDGPLRPELEAYAQDLGIAKHVHFIGATQDVKGVLSLVDLFALTSDNEASPVSIMEALSCQRAVVAPAVGSIDETVIHGKTGFLFPAGNRQQASDHWLKLLEDPQLATDFGRAGRQHVIANCSLNTMTDGYTRLIERLHASKVTCYQPTAIKMHSNSCDLS